VQLGLLDPSTLPIAGVETARKVADPSLPSNQLMQRQRPAGAAKDD
jgi:carboxymethylenebutenolidase